MDGRRRTSDMAASERRRSHRAWTTGAFREGARCSSRPRSSCPRREPFSMGDATPSLAEGVDIQRPAWMHRGRPQASALLHNEWLVTNGLGGYASGTVGGVMTRKYHGYLIAALPAPLGRMVMLQNLQT